MQNLYHEVIFLKTRILTLSAMCQQMPKENRQTEHQFSFFYAVIILFEKNGVLNIINVLTVPN